MFECENNSHVQSKSVEPRRRCFILKSLDWDSAVFNCEGLLSPNELCMINKSFKKETSWDSDEFPLDSTLKSDTVNDVSPDIQRKMNPRKTKAAASPSSVLSPLSSSNTSPAHDSCRMLEGRKFLTSPYTIKSSIKKIEFSGLRKPSSRLGFFN